MAESYVALLYDKHWEFFCRMILTAPLEVVLVPNTKPMTAARPTDPPAPVPDGCRRFVFATQSDEARIYKEDSHV